MAAGRTATIDERDVYIRVIDQGVREGHPHRPRTHDEVVGFQRSLCHGARPSSRLDPDLSHRWYKEATPWRPRSDPYLPLAVRLLRWHNN